MPERVVREFGQVDDTELLQQPGLVRTHRLGRQIELRGDVGDADAGDEYLPENPWIQQPFEIYDTLRPEALRARLA